MLPVLEMSLSHELCDQCDALSAPGSVTASFFNSAPVGFTVARLGMTQTFTSWVDGFTHTRRKPSLTGLSYKVWTSTDLSTWTQDFTAVQSPTTEGDIQNVVVTLTGAPLTATKLFVRVTAD